MHFAPNSSVFGAYLVYSTDTEVFWCLGTIAPPVRLISKMQYTIANNAKASFDDVYNARTPHAYLAKLAGLGYVGPQDAIPRTRATGQGNTGKRRTTHRNNNPKDV